MKCIVATRRFSAINMSGGNEMKKSVVYWAGLILIGLCLWGSFVVFWMLGSMYVWWSGGWHDYRIGISIILMVGAAIFTSIGLYMMKEGREA